MKRNAALFLLVFLVASFSATVIANGYNPHPRPIDGFMNGGASWAMDGKCDAVNGDPVNGIPGVTTKSDMVGDVSHLGRTEYHSTHCATNDASQLLLGDATLIAANGDEIWLEYTANVIPPVMIPGTVVYEVTNVVVGGTGRFENATGVIPALVFVTITFDGGIPNAQLDMEFSGNLSY